MTEKPKQFTVCPKCKSQDIGFDAYASWDPDTQEMYLVSSYPNAMCNDCEYESKDEFWTEEDPNA